MVAFFADVLMFVPLAVQDVIILRFPIVTDLATYDRDVTFQAPVINIEITVST